MITNKAILVNLTKIKNTKPDQVKIKFTLPNNIDNNAVTEFVVLVYCMWWSCIVLYTSRCLVFGFKSKSQCEGSGTIGRPMTFVEGFSKGT